MPVFGLSCRKQVFFYACYPEGSRDFISFAERLFQKSWHIMEALMGSLTW